MNNETNQKLFGVAKRSCWHSARKVFYSAGDLVELGGGDAPAPDEGIVKRHFLVAATLEQAQNLYAAWLKNPTD